MSRCCFLEERFIKDEEVSSRTHLPITTRIQFFVHNTRPCREEERDQYTTREKVNKRAHKEEKKVCHIIGIE